MSNINTTYALFEVVDYKNENVLSSYNLGITPFTFKADIATTNLYSNVNKAEALFDFGDGTVGSGLTATNGVLSVDAIANNIVEADFQMEDETSNCNGVTTDFTLDNSPVVNSVQVFLNGALQAEGSGKDYTLSGTTVSFATAPESGDVLIIHYVINN